MGERLAAGGEGRKLFLQPQPLPLCGAHAFQLKGLSLHRIGIIALTFCLVLGACGKGASSTSSASKAAPAASAPAVTLPLTLEGELAIDHANDWGVWGTLKVNATENHVAVPASIYD